MNDIHDLDTTGTEIRPITIDDEEPLYNCRNCGCWEILGCGIDPAREARKRIKEGGKIAIMEHGGQEMEKSITRAFIQWFGTQILPYFTVPSSVFLTETVCPDHNILWSHLP